MKFSIVKNIDCPKTLKTLSPGNTVKIASKDFASLGTVHSAIFRLNKASGFKEFNVTSPDNGTTLIITRNKENV